MLEVGCLTLSYPHSKRIDLKSREGARGVQEVGGEKQKGEEVEKGREKKEKSRGGGEEEMEKKR